MGNLFACNIDTSKLTLVRTLRSGRTYATDKECVIIVTAIDSSSNAALNNCVLVVEHGTSEELGNMSYISDQYKNDGGDRAYVGNAISLCKPTGEHDLMTISLASMPLYAMVFEKQ